MRKPSRFLRVISAAGLLISLVAATITPAAAQQNLPGEPAMDMIFETANPAFRSGPNAVYYPWVANDEEFGLGPADTSISVQNLEDRDSQIWVYVGNGDNTWTLATSAYLSAYAAKTFSAEQLGIAEGEGAPVAVLAFHRFSGPAFGLSVVETEVSLGKPAGVAGDFTQVIACVVNEMVTETYGTPAPFKAAVSFTYNGTTYAKGALVEWSTQAELQAILEAANAGNTGALINPFGGINSDGDCFDAFAIDEGGSFLDSVAIAGVAKQAVDGEDLPMTSEADSAVSGYNAISGSEVFVFHEWYLPIVQTNCGPGGCWDSMLRVANLSNLNSAVTVRFFPSDDGSGSLQTGFQVQELVNGGETWHINLGDLVPEGWVGSAHVYSDGEVFAMVDRYKVGYNMWLTNTGSSADFENIAQVDGANGRYALFAPHVLLDYFGWNTGINVANLYNGDNNVSLQYFNTLGNATQVLNQRLAPHGMTYFYDPSVAPQDNNQQDVTNDPNAGVVGSAIIWSDHPVAAAVDATKYPETDPNGGADLFQGISYSATQNVFTWQAVALVQKGNPTDGMGDTSGINIMNPNATAATANVYFVNPSGFNAQNFGVSSVTIPGFANGFVYTMTQHNLPNGFVGAAQVISNVPVAAVSANVNYAVDGDGSAIFNAANPCGFSRVRFGCDFGDPLDPTGGSVTKTFVDEVGSPVSGVEFYIVGDNPAFPYQRSGVSDVDGSRTFTNVPVGNYELHVTSVPSQYLLPANPADTFTLIEGEDEVLENTVLWAQGFEKTVCATGTVNLVGGDFVDCDVTLSGVNVSVYENIGTNFIAFPVAGDLVYDGLTGLDGTVSSRLPVGNYILCIWDTSETALTSNGETVIPDLATSGGFGVADCDTFSVAAGVNTELVNEVDIVEGVLNVFVYTEEPTDVGGVFDQAGVAGVDVCLDGVCVVTGAEGFARFTGVEEGDHSVAVQSDDNTVTTMTGGSLTVELGTLTEDGLAATPATVIVTYDPTEDVAQDGFVDDVDAGSDVGSFDLNVVMDSELAGTLSKTVEVEECVDDEGTEVCSFEPVGAGYEVSITPEGGVATLYTTDVSGNVTVDLAAGTYTVCSTVLDDVQCDAAVVIVDDTTTTITNQHSPVGQIDIQNVSTAATRPGADQQYCLEELDGSTFSETGCILVPTNGFSTEDSNFFAGVQAGVYRLNIWDSTQTTLLGTTTAVSYSVIADFESGTLDDVANAIAATSGRGNIQVGGSPDSTQDAFVLTSIQ